MRRQKSSKEVFIRTHHSNTSTLASWNCTFSFHENFRVLKNLEGFRLSKFSLRTVWRKRRLSKSKKIVPFPGWTVHPSANGWPWKYRGPYHRPIPLDSFFQVLIRFGHFLFPAIFDHFQLLPLLYTRADDTLLHLQFLPVNGSDQCIDSEELVSEVSEPTSWTALYPSWLSSSSRTRFFDSPQFFSSLRRFLWKIPPHADNAEKRPATLTSDIKSPMSSSWTWTTRRRLRGGTDRRLLPLLEPKLALLPNAWSITPAIPFHASLSVGASESERFQKS